MNAFEIICFFVMVGMMLWLLMFILNELFHAILRKSAAKRKDAKLRWYQGFTPHEGRSEDDDS